ncbi:MAG: DUF4175 family protein, partial [Deltaproteobacteria bacterium]|nr:DUF4175 family protein [Deltaproteobacteria bacterium]
MLAQSDNVIVSFARKVRAVAVRRVLANATLILILVAAAAFLATYAIGDSSGVSSALVASVRGVVVVLASLAAVWAIGSWVQSRRARFVGDRLRPAHGAFAGHLRSALELSTPAQTKDVDGFSPTLIGAHIRAVELEAETVNIERLFPAPRYRLWAIVLVPTVAACFFIAGLGPKAAAEAWLRLLGLASPPAASTRAVIADRAIVHDLTLRLKYPAYMAKAPRAIDGSTGDVQAPIGTVVDVSVRAVSAPGPRDTLVLDRDGDETRFSRSHDARFTASFVVRQSGPYRIGLRSPQSRDTTWDPTDRQIRVEPDRDPTVSIAAPGPHLEVSPKQRVDVSFRASDDYGLRSLELEVWEVGSAPKRSRVRTFAVPPREADGTIALDVALYRPRAGVPLHYRFIATDNNTLSPGTGSSSTHTLLVVSPREKHRRLLDRARRAWESLVEILGDRLEHVLPLVIDAELLTKIRATNKKTATLAEGLSELAKAFAELPPPKAERAVAARIDATLARIAGRLKAQAAKWHDPTERRERRSLFDLRASTVPALED